MHIIDLFPLSEARRNPDVNRKVSMLDELKKYAGQKDVYVTFTHDVGVMSHGHKGDAYSQRKAVDSGEAYNARGAKIGINPSSTYKTPLGIYAYPLEYVIKKKEQGKGVEFGADRPHMWVFRANGKVIDLANYTQSDLEEDLKKLGTSVSRMNNAIMHARVGTPGGQLWAATRALALDKAERKLEDDAEAGAEEREEEAWQYYLNWHRRDFTYTKKEYHEMHGDEDSDEHGDDDEEYDDDDEEIFDEEECREAFQAQYVDDELYPSEEDVASKAAPYWNQVFRNLGISGVVDSAGEEIIHENEPTQAVFFSMRDIKVLQLVDNITPEEPKTQEEIWYKQPKALMAAIRNGKVSDDRMIALIDQSPIMAEKIGFDMLSEKVKEYIRDNAAQFFRQYYGDLKPYQIGMNDDQTIRLFADQPGWASTYPAFTPAVKAYVLSHTKDFREYFDSLPLTDAEKLHAMQADPSIYQFMSKIRPSQFLQNYMLEYDPGAIMNRLASTEFSTETCVNAFVRFLKKAKTAGDKKSGRDMFLSMLSRRNDNFEAFLACFAKITPAAALYYVTRDNMSRSMLGDKTLLTQMCDLQPRCEEFLAKIVPRGVGWKPKHALKKLDIDSTDSENNDLSVTA
jgi:hypothetical protein